MNLKIQISKFSSAPVLAYPKPWSPFSLSKQNKTASSSLSSPKFLKKRQIKFILLHSFLDPLLLLLLLLKKKKNYSIYDKELFSNHWNLRTMKTLLKKEFPSHSPFSPIIVIFCTKRKRNLKNCLEDLFVGLFS